MAGMRERVVKSGVVLWGSLASSRGNVWDTVFIDCVQVRDTVNKLLSGRMVLIGGMKARPITDCTALTSSEATVICFVNNKQQIFSGLHKKKADLPAHRINPRI